MRCNTEGCTVKNAVFAFNEESKERYCKIHKQKGMKDVKNKRCEHNKIKTTCKDCKGSSFCIHERRKTICRECTGG